MAVEIGTTKVTEIGTTERATSGGGTGKIENRGMETGETGALNSGESGNGADASGESKSGVSTSGGTTATNPLTILVLTSTSASGDKVVRA